MAYFEEEELVYVVVNDKWDLRVYRGKIEEVRGCRKYLVIMDVRNKVEYVNMFTERKIVDRRVLYKREKEANKYLKEERRKRIDEYKKRIKSVGDLVDYCVHIGESKKTELNKRLAREAIIERKEELGV